MNKFLLFLGCIFLISYYMNHTQEHNISSKEMIKQIQYLEIEYNHKLLRAYGIDPNELNILCEQYPDYQDKVEFKKKYIMEKANLTEAEYQDIFVHPLSQIKDSKETTIQDLQNSYEDLQNKINKIDKLIDLVNN